MFGLSWFQGSTAQTLTAAQEEMYALERNDNLRWAAKAFALRSSYTLTESDLASPELVEELAELGQFAEVAHGTLSPRFIWKNLASLTQEGYPLEGFNALKNTELLDVFRGDVADYQGYAAYRPFHKQLIVCFSGTSNIMQGLYDANAIFTAHPAGNGASVHMGFWSIYCGVKDTTFKALQAGLVRFDVEEIVVSGHSLGGVMSYLFALDLLREQTTRKRVKLAVFGSPRIGNDRLVEHWQGLINSQVAEVKDYSVRVYNDGRSSVVRSLSSTPLTPL
jgi:hypothetical protein